MDIAILRTEQADQECSYNKVEYPAARYGVRVSAYVDSTTTGTFRGVPVLRPDSLLNSGVELIVAASPLTLEHRQALIAAGWPADRLLSFVTQPDECLTRWQAADSRWLSVRAVKVVDEEFEHVPWQAEMSDRAIEDMPSALSAQAHTAIVERVLHAYFQAEADAPTSGPYVIGRIFKVGFSIVRPNFYRAVADRDVPALQALLASCFRNELTIGMFGGREAYDAYVSRGSHVFIELRQQFNVWKNSVATLDLTHLQWPMVGNPYGVRIGDGVVHPNTLLNDYRAEHVLELVNGVDRPIVVDLGGGYGGFGRQLMARNDDAVYVGFDLPENLMVASYFLLAAHPDKRVLLYESARQPLDLETLRNYDIILMPNFMLPRVASRSIDVFTNFMSLSEMEYGTIAEYLHQVDRVCRGFFYQENVLDNGDYNDFYPAPVFPALPHFKQISRAPSRWPWFGSMSPAHCHGEVLSVHREVDHHRYLRSRHDVGVEPLAMARGAA